jgi:sugar lactone lactonase YvrE
MLNRTFVPALAAMVLSQSALAQSPAASPGAPRVENRDPAERTRVLRPETPLAAIGPVQRVLESRGVQWTGLAITNDRRTFVSFPRWAGPLAMSVAEVITDAQGRSRLSPYPDLAWNAWRENGPLAASAAFVCVQALHADGDRLFILDPGSPGLAGTVPGAPKLVFVDLRTDTVARVYRFDESIAPKNSYLNNLRVDRRWQYAYITDSGTGAIITLDLQSGKATRLLADHPSTKAEPDVIPTVGGKPWLGPDGKVPQVHADGIALSRDGQHLYWQALTARTLYRIKTAWLRDPQGPPPVELLGTRGGSVLTDGMEIDAAGNLYFTALERDAIIRRAPDGTYTPVAQGPELAWPDSFAWHPDGSLHVTTAQIHRTPPFAPAMPLEPYRVLRIVRPTP